MEDSRGSKRQIPSLSRTPMRLASFRMLGGKNSYLPRFLCFREKRKENSPGEKAGERRNEKGEERNTQDKEHQP